MSSTWPRMRCWNDSTGERGGGGGMEGAAAEQQWSNSHTAGAALNGNSSHCTPTHLLPAPHHRLRSVLEPGRSLTLAEKGGAGAEVVVAHPAFRIAATMNPGGCASCVPACLAAWLAGCTFCLAGRVFDSPPCPLTNTHNCCCCFGCCCRRRLRQEGAVPRPLQPLHLHLGPRHRGQCRAAGNPGQPPGG